MDEGTRVCSNVDLIVPPAQLHRAIEVIVSAGSMGLPFRLYTPAIPLMSRPVPR
jgi:hypothetical protein